jgi:hypothetical protein
MNRKSLVKPAYFSCIFKIIAITFLNPLVWLKHIRAGADLGNTLTLP